MKPKTYNFKGKTVIAVPEKRKNTCEGCLFERDGKPCLETEQAAAGIPNCADNNLILKLATDEKI